MKKSAKWILLILAVLTVACVVAAIVMVKAVWGDALFYMDSRLGNFYAVSYRPVCLASAALILFWVLLGIKKHSLFTAKLAASKNKKEAITEARTDPETIFCGQCGTQLAKDTKFCSSCGAPVKAAGTEDTIILGPEDAISTEDSEGNPKE